MRLGWRSRQVGARVGGRRWRQGPLAAQGRARRHDGRWLRRRSRRLELEGAREVLLAHWGGRWRRGGRSGLALRSRRFALGGGNLFIGKSEFRLVASQALWRFRLLARRSDALFGEALGCLPLRPESLGEAVRAIGLRWRSDTRGGTRRGSGCPRTRRHWCRPCNGLRRPLR